MSSNPALDAIIAQLYSSAIPEWSVSKGEQPVDIGTLISNLNYQQDVTSTFTDPLLGAMSGFLDPSAFDPVQKEMELPEQPLSPRYEAYERSSSPIQTMILAGIREGLDPRAVVQRLVDEGELVMPVNEADGKVDTSEFDYYVSEAQGLRDEVAERNRWEADYQRAATPQYEDSEMAEKFKSFGFQYMPNEQYDASVFQPQLAALEAKAAPDQRKMDAWAASERARTAPGYQAPVSTDRRSGPRGGRGRGRQIPKQEGQALTGQQKAIHSAGRDFGLGAVEALINRKVGEQRSSQAAAQGITPFMAELMGRAGL